MKAARRPIDRSQAQRPFFLRRGFFGFVAALAAFGVFAAIVWTAYEEEQLSGTEAQVPMVRAEKGPIKLRPKTPGGMDVPFQDKLVYDQLSEAPPKPQVTQLLPPPEEPVAPPKAPAAESLAEQAPPKTEVLRLLEEAPVAAPKPVEKPAKAAPKPAEKLAKAAPKPAEKLAKAAPKPAEKTEPTPTPKVTASAAPIVAKGGRIQVAALRSERDALDQWARLQKAHGDLLGGLTPHVQRVDLGAKGIFFRLQAGPIDGRGAAKALCAKLQKRKSGCLVVRP